MLEFISDHFVLSFLWISLLVSVVYLTVFNWFSNFSEILCYQVVQLMNKKHATIVDIRQRNDYCLGHIINSINMSFDDVRSRNACELLKFKINPVIIVCRDGMHSRVMARYLCKLGFKQIYVLKGGIISWSKESLPLVQGK